MEKLVFSVQLYSAIVCLVPFIRMHTVWVPVKILESVSFVCVRESERLHKQFYYSVVISDHNND